MCILRTDGRANIGHVHTKHEQQECTTKTVQKDIKSKPVYAVTERKSPCTRCGLEFSQNHLAVCKAKNERCRNCSTIGHFARMCKRPKSGNDRGRGSFTGRSGMRRINLIEQEADQWSYTLEGTIANHSS